MNNEPDMLFVYEPAKTIPPPADQKSRRVLRSLFLIETVALIVGGALYRVVIHPQISILHERPETIVRVFLCSILALACAVALTLWRPTVSSR